jgi:hypothetical protein
LQCNGLLTCTLLTAPCQHKQECYERCLLAAVKPTKPSQCSCLCWAVCKAALQHQWDLTNPTWRIAAPLETHTAFQTTRDQPQATMTCTTCTYVQTTTPAARGGAVKPPPTAEVHQKTSKHSSLLTAQHNPLVTIPPPNNQLPGGDLLLLRPAPSDKSHNQVRETPCSRACNEAQPTAAALLPGPSFWCGRQGC